MNTVDYIGIWVVVALAAGAVAYMRGGRPLPWLVGALLFPPLVLWVMLMPLAPRNSKRAPKVDAP